MEQKEALLLQKMSIGSIYEHYSGKCYRVVGVARHSEDLSLYVYYEALYDGGQYGQFWMRPLAMFLENVMVNGQEVPRFKKVP